MAERLPLVFVDGKLSQLPDGDSISGVDTGTLSAGSGLVGGGDLSFGSQRLDVAIATNSSGVIFVNDAIGIDGSAEARADEALISGNAALRLGEDATNSGIAAQASGNIALASGNAALFNAVNFLGGSNLTNLASSDIQAGDAVGVDDSGHFAVLGSITAAANKLSVSGIDINKDVFGSLTTGNTYPSLRMGYDPVQSGILVLYPGETSFYIHARAALISGGELHFGTAVALTSINLGNVDIGLDFDSHTNQFVWSHKGSSTSQHYYSTLQISGGTVEVGPELQVPSVATVTDSCLSYNPAFRRFASLRKTGTTLYGQSVETSGNYVVLTDGTSDTQVSTTAHYTLSSAVYCPETSGNFFISLTPSTDYPTIISTAPSGNNISIIEERKTDVRVNTLVRQGITYIPETQNIFTFFHQTFPTPAGPTLRTFKITDFNCPGSGVFSDDILRLYGSGNGDSKTGQTPIYYDGRIVAPLMSGQDSAASGYITAALLKPSGTESYEILDHVLLSGTPSRQMSPASVVDHDGRVYVANARRDDPSGGSGFIFTLGPLEGYYPSVSAGGKDNFIGISKDTVSSGDQVKVDLPRSVNYDQENLETGRFYYVNPQTSGFTTATGVPFYWNGGTEWKAVGKATSSSGMLILDTI